VLIDQDFIWHRFKHTPRIHTFVLQLTEILFFMKEFTLNLALDYKAKMCVQHWDWNNSKCGKFQSNTLSK